MSNIEEASGHGCPEVGQGWAQLTGIGPDPERPLHEYWSHVLTQAAHSLGPTDGEGWHSVRTTVYIKHQSPGWIDGFRVQLVGGGQ